MSWVVLVVLVVVAVGIWGRLAWLWRDIERSNREILEAMIRERQVSAPAVESVKGPDAVVTAPVAPQVEVRFVGGEFGGTTERMPARARKPTLKRGLDVYQQWYPDRDVWVYRRVTTERAAR